MTYLRSECNDSRRSALSEVFAFKGIYYAVRDCPGLSEGKLHDNGSSCAIGAFWDAQPNATLSNDLIDEVAAVNDSVPYMTKRQRRAHVLRWLRWKLDRLGVQGIRGPR